jgi:hypothetical protein
MDFLILLVILIAFVKWLFKQLKEQPLKNQSEDKESLSPRQDYYRNVYLKSDEWQRKRNPSPPHSLCQNKHWQGTY